MTAVDVEARHHLAVGPCRAYPVPSADSGYGVRPGQDDLPIRDHDGGARRAFIRFFACEQDLSQQSPDTPLPEAVASGAEPYLIAGAMAGG